MSEVALLRLLIEALPTLEVPGPISPGRTPAGRAR
jgi:hypothetical protein